MTKMIDLEQCFDNILRMYNIPKKELKYHLKVNKHIKRFHLAFSKQTVSLKNKSQIKGNFSTEVL